MMTNPLPIWLIGLNLFVPGIWLLSFRASRSLFEQGLAALAASVGLALGGWLLTTHLLALLAGSFVVGVTCSTSVLGILGYLLGRGAARSLLRWDSLPSSLTWGFFVLCTIPVAILAWRWDFHDETSQNGHLAIIASIQNAYPPRNLSFPEFPLQYHYGFNLLCTMLIALFRLSLVRAIDIATIALWMYSLLALWVLGERIVGRGYGIVMAAFVALGAGLPFTCEASLALALPAVSHVLYPCSVGDLPLNPPFISYFFQHPWTLGVPLALAAMLVQAEDRQRRRWLRLGVLICLLAALCLTQTALFCALTGAMLASEFVDERTEPWLLRLRAGAVLLGGALLGVLLVGGFWSQPGVLSDKLVPQWGVVSGWLESLRWMWGTFGFLLAGFVGVFWLERRRVLFTVLALGGILIINVVRYADTWDIVKFATVAALGLSVMLAGLVKRLRSSRWSALQLGASSALTLATLFGGVSFLLASPIDQPGVPFLYRHVAPSFPKDDLAAAEYLRDRMPIDSVMYRKYAAFRPYALFAGLPQVWIETPFPINLKLAPGRNDLVNRWPSAESAYLEHGLRFFVLDEDEGALGRVVEVWLSKGTARLLQRFGSLRVVELLVRTEPTAQLESTIAPSTRKLASYADPI